MLKVVGVNEGWFFYDKVTLRADILEECFLWHNAGSDRYPVKILYRYYITAGRKIQIRLPKKWCIMVGDELDFMDLVKYNSAPFYREDTGKHKTNRPMSQRRKWEDEAWYFGPEDGCEPNNPNHIWKVKMPVDDNKQDTV